MDNREKLSRPQDKMILSKLAGFISGALYSESVSSVNLMKSAILLLNELPFARIAILDYLANIFEEGVKYFATNQKQIVLTDKANNDNIEALLLAKNALNDLISENASGWVSLILPWSINLCASLSHKYKSRRETSSHAAFYDLNLWINSSSMICLLDIINLSSDKEIAVTSILQTASQNTPSFDWVIIYISMKLGKEFILQMIVHGIRELSEKDWSISSQLPNKLAPLCSVLNALSILMAQEMLACISEIFSTTCIDTSPSFEEAKTIPFFLKLSSISEPLANIIISTIFPLILNKVELYVPALYYHLRSSHCAKFFNHKESSLLPLAIHLLTRCEKDCFEVFKLLLQISQSQITYDEKSSSEDFSKNIQSISTKVLEMFNHKLQQLLGSISDISSPLQYIEVPFVSGLISSIPRLFPLYENSNTNFERVYIKRFIIFACISIHNEGTAFVLLKCLAQTKFDVYIYTNIIEAVQCFGLNPIKSLISSLGDKLFHQIREDEEVDDFPGNVLKNLLHIIKFRTSHALRHKFYLQKNLSCILKSANFHQQSSFIDLIIYLKPDHRTLDLETILFLSKVFVHIFFNVVSSNFLHSSDKEKHLIKELSLLIAKCDKSLHFVFSEIFSGIFSGKWDQYLSITNSQSHNKRALFDEQKMLYDERDESLLLTQLESVYSKSERFSYQYLLHSGKMSYSDKKSTQSYPSSSTDQYVNMLFAVDTVFHLCLTSDNIHLSLQGLIDEIFQSLNIPTLICFGVEGSDNYWLSMDSLDEQAIVTTTGCDLKQSMPVLIAFNKFSFLRSLLTFFADHKSLHLCNPILRSLLIYCTITWKSCITKDPQLLQLSSFIIGIMSQSNFFPYPIKKCHLLFSSISPYEVHLILRNLSNYLNNNPFVPQSSFLSTSTQESHLERPAPSPEFMQLLHSIFQKNIKYLGILYKDFYYIPKCEPLDDVGDS